MQYLIFFLYAIKLAWMTFFRFIQSSNRNQSILTVSVHIYMRDIDELQAVIHLKPAIKYCICANLRIQSTNAIVFIKHGAQVVEYLSVID